MLDLDDWQRKVLETEGNICLRSGRQVGKSTIIAVKVGDYATKNAKKSVMIISHTERQSYLLFSKVLGYLFDNYKQWIKKGKDRPTKSEIKLTNGSVIRCLPTGLDGIGIRGYTVDLLIADEAAFIPEDVWAAVTPMLATTKGNIILLSTPKGIGNFFYNCFQDKSFTAFHVSSEECGRIDKEFLKREKETKSKLVYAQEYLGEFTDNLRQMFSDKLIKELMLLDRPSVVLQKEYYLGVDVARMGGDECTFEIVKRVGDIGEHVENFVTDNILIPDTINKILELEKIYNFKQIFIDTGGMGVAVFDFLLRNEATRRKVTAIDNATRPIEYEGSIEHPRKRALMKEHLYMNLLKLMEQKKIKLLKDENLFFSLKSIQCEYTDSGDLKIFGTYTHIAEGLIRAAWGLQNKTLNLWVKYR